MSEKQFIEVDEQLLDEIKQKLAVGSITAIKEILKIFTICFNEKTLENTKFDYEINNKAIMIEVLDIYLLDTSEQLRKLTVNKKKNKLLTMLYLKNVLVFLDGLKNSSLLTRTLTAVKNFVDLFEVFPRMNKHLLQSVLSVWEREDQFPVKFYSFLLVKQMLQKNKEKFQIHILKKLLLVYQRSFSVFSWRVYNSQKFMRNSLVELFTLVPSMAFIVLYDKLKNLSQFIIQISQQKQIEKLKKLQNHRTFHLCDLFTHTVITLRNNPEIRELTYPVIEVINCLFSLNPKLFYYPMMLNLTKLKILISSQTGLNVPVFAQLQQLLSCKWIRKQFKQSKFSGFDFAINVKVSKELLQNNEFWTHFLTQLLDTVCEDLNCHINTPYFLTYSSKIIYFLKRMAKTPMSLENKVLIKNKVKMIKAEIEVHEKTLDRRADPFEYKSGNYKYPKEVSQFREKVKEIRAKNEELIKLNVESAKNNQDRQFNFYNVCFKCHVYQLRLIF